MCANSRRQFLSALAVLPLAARETRASAQQRSGSVVIRDLELSAADSLVAYIEMIRKSQVEVLSVSSRSWIDAHAPVAEGLERIAALAEKLAIALGRSAPRGADAFPADGVGGPSAHDVHNYLAAVEKWTSVQPVQLSPEASRLLDELLAEIRRVRALHARSLEAGRSHNTAFEETERIVVRVRDLLLEAGNTIAKASLNGENSPEGAAQVRRAAKEFRALFQAGPSPTGAALLEMLEGVALWAEGKTPPATPRGFEFASTGEAEQNPGLETGGLVALLREHCPTATRWRAVALVLLLMPIWILHSNRQARVPLIRVALQHFTCHESRDPDKFVMALSAIGLPASAA